MAQQENVSADLIWEISRTTNSYLVKRKSAGGVQFSKDPLNLMNKHSRKYAGFVNDKVHVQSVPAELDYRAKTKETEELTLLPRPKAVGIHLSKNEGIALITKKTKHRNRPASNKNEVLWSSNKSGPKIYKGIANYTAKQGYRADLRQEAVARASTIRQSQRPKKDAREKKVRGAKAKDAADKA